MVGRSVIVLVVIGASVGAGSLAAQAQVMSPCVSSNCARVTVGGASGAAGSTVALPVSFVQAPNDGQSGQGNDDVAAIALTVGLGPVDAPLRLTDAGCEDTNGDELPDAVTVSDGIRSGFRVVVENYRCTSRNRCLCPGEGQTRDHFVNVVVYGPKDLPTEGPVDIPVLPDGELFTIGVQIPGGAAGSIPVHVFAETDSQSGNPKPQFGAFLSIGDQSAIDQTADRDANVSKVAVENGTVTVVPVTISCAGDCNDDGSVKINELVSGVNIALGNAALGTCPSFDTSGSGQVEINELIKAVNNALNGCPS